MRKMKITWLLLGVFLIFTSHSVLALNPEDFPFIDSTDEATKTDNVLTVSICPAGSFELTDPEGKRLGFNILTKKVQKEIPNIQASVEAIDDPETDKQEIPPTWRIDIFQPIEGNYILKVWHIPGKQYYLGISNEAGLIKELAKITFSKESIHIFDIQLDKKGNWTIIRRK
jgi:hypothetical protein